MLEPRRLALTVVLCGGGALGGVEPGELFPLPNADFEAGLANWIQESSDGSAPFLAAAAPRGPGLAAYCDLPAGTEARLVLSVPIGPGSGVDSAPEPGRPGEKVGLGAWVWLAGGGGPGAVRVSLEAFDGAATTTLAESLPLDPAQAPANRWLFLQALPDPLFDARVPSGTLELRYVLSSSAPGALWFDALRAGGFEYSGYPLENASFEEGLPTGGAWTPSGLVVANDAAGDPDGYYGIGHARLEGWAGTSLSQEILVPRSPSRFAPSPQTGSEVEAGGWVRIASDAYLPVVASPAIYVELALWADPGGAAAETLIARGRWHPTIEDRGFWRFLQTESLARIPGDARRLRIEFTKSFSSNVHLDFVQAGERFAIDGNPRRLVGCNYVGRYRSPLSPDAYTDPSSPRELWRNWCWITPNACNAGFQGFFHNPDCATSAACMRPNGRRDLAVSPLESEHDLPLVGAYDSRDQDVVRYHVDLARAVGIDHFIYDWLGHRLAVQEAMSGREPLNEEAFEVLFDVAEEPGSDFKIAVMYEPKVHFNGWVAGEPTHAEKLAGIALDLTWLVEHLRERRSALRRDGQLVVYVFRNTVCTPDGSQCLDDSDWTAIIQGVEAAAGEELFLIADVAPQGPSPFRGLSRWQLVSRELLEYRTYTDVETGVPTWPPPSIDALEDHVGGVHRLGRDWAAEDDAERLGVAVVWPDFDDAGVGGWGTANLTGEDGQSLCVRVAADFDGGFYRTTAFSALDTGCNWIHLATWNDWNENTRLEPAWHPDFLTGPFTSSSPSPRVARQVFGRLTETAAWISVFKGETLPATPLEGIARDYLTRAALLPEVIEYD